MRKLKLYIASSLDGYIARKNGNVDWLHDERFETEGEDYGYHAFYDSIDTCLMGYKTYQFILDADIPYPYADKISFVFSRSPQVRTAHVQFVHENIPGYVSNLKEQEGKDIWLVGGGQINSLLLKAGLIDELILTLIPIVLGEGIPLFAPTSYEQHFQLNETISYDNGMLQLWYEKR